MNKISKFILGAGMTGLAAGLASGLPVYEAADTPGGICSSYYIRPNDQQKYHIAPDDGEARPSRWTTTAPPRRSLRSYADRPGPAREPDSALTRHRILGILSAAVSHVIGEIPPSLSVRPAEGGDEVQVAHLGALAQGAAPLFSCSWGSRKSAKDPHS